MLPFFAPFQEFARSVSVTRTADAPGFAFYMYMVEKTGEMRPFVIYVIEEGGARVVANVLVDLFVEGRHLPQGGGGMEVPRLRVILHPASTRQRSAGSVSHTSLPWARSTWGGAVMRSCVPSLASTT